MKKKFKLNEPNKVTIGDAMLAYQMGYRAICEDGKLKGFEREVA